MGKRGPAALPIERHRLMGSSAQYKRHGEVVIVDGEPVPPEWLPEDARPHWDFWVTHLGNQGISSPAWYIGLAQWAMAVSEWEDFEKQCIAARSNGTATFMTDKGAVVANPIFAMRDRAHTRIKEMGAKFGYTPSDKTGIRTGEPGLPKNRKGYIKRA